MKSLFNLVMVATASMVLIIGSMDMAEAKRLGSGSSFGSKFSHSQNVKKSSPAQAASNPSPAAQTNAARQQQLSSKGGLMGMLGGLALGGLLGALFFGGAFEGLNIMDILLFAGIAFILYMLFASKARRPQPAGHAPYHQAPADNAHYRENIGDHVSPQATTAAAASFGGVSLDQLRGDIIRDFDKEAFLEGSKSCYARMQNAWDEGDLADIRQFTTDHVFAEIQDQYRARGEHTSTKITALNAELLSVKHIGESMEASVLFEAKLIEDGENQKVTEVWHFIRPTNTQQPTWFLDGIQQVTDE